MMFYNTNCLICEYIVIGYVVSCGIVCDDDNNIQLFCLFHFCINFLCRFLYIWIVLMFFNNKVYWWIEYKHMQLVYTSDVGYYYFIRKNKNIAIIILMINYQYTAILCFLFSFFYFKMCFELVSLVYSSFWWLHVRTFVDQYICLFIYYLWIV